VPGTRLPLFWRVFAANAGVLVVVAVLLLVTPVTVHAPIRLVEALIIVAGLGVALMLNVVLLRRAFVPLDRLGHRMATVDLLRPDERLPVGREDQVGLVIRAFNEMLDRLERERRESGRRALTAQENERARIARGLHDEVGQVLTGVLLQLNSVSDAFGAERQRDLEDTQQMVRQALEEVRRISQELRPELLEHLGLVSALTELTRAFRGLEIVRDFDQQLPALSADAELAVYRIAQESLTNVARHSQANNVRVSLHGNPRSVVLQVADDGKGFNGGRPPRSTGGLRGMEERAILVGGSLAIQPSSSGGASVRFEVPAEAADTPSKGTL
jgi:two-component system sensor histidine kinase UhpB